MEQLRHTPIPIDAGSQIKSFEELAAAKNVKGVEVLEALEYCANSGIPIKADVVIGILGRVNLRENVLRSFVPLYTNGAINQIRKIGAGRTHLEEMAALDAIREWNRVAKFVVNKLYPRPQQDSELAS